MTPAERLSASIRSPKAGGPALMPYITSGYPTMAGYRDLVESVSQVADAIEIGVPFSDPMADGRTIQETSQVALSQGVTLDWILRELEAAKLDCPLVLMSYLNPLLSFGFEDLMIRAKASGICGFIIPDLPWEESAQIREQAVAHGLALVQLVTPVTPAPRQQMLCEGSGGFVYAVTMTGITGQDVSPEQVTSYLDQLREWASVPVCAGFGIRTAEHVAALGGHADGAIVGSAFLRALGDGVDAAEFVKGLRPTS